MEIMIHLNNAVLPSCWEGEVQVEVTPQKMSHVQCQTEKRVPE